MSTLLEKILANKVIDGRVTSQSDKEQWTCLQKIIAINKLIVDYHNAFVELKESYDELTKRYNEINAEWDVLKTDMEAIATEWTHFKPLVQQIINLWENTITPTFEEWTTLMNNWGNTMDGYASAMADYQQTMQDISQSFQNIEQQWEAITLEIRGKYDIEYVNFDGNAGTTTFTKTYSLDEVNDIIICLDEGHGRLSNIKFEGTSVYKDNGDYSPVMGTYYPSWRFSHLGLFTDHNNLYELSTPDKFMAHWTDPTEQHVTITLQLGLSQTAEFTIYTRYVPYFSADQSSEIEQAKTTANTALATANTAKTTADSANTKATQAINAADQALSISMTKGTKFDLIYSDDPMTTKGETRTFPLNSSDYRNGSILYIEGNPSPANTDTFATSCMSIPLVAIPSVASASALTKRYQLADESNYISCKLGMNSARDTLYMKFDSANAASGVGFRIAFVYG